MSHNLVVSVLRGAHNACNPQVAFDGGFGVRTPPSGFAEQDCTDMSVSEKHVNARASGREFSSTHWSVVLRASDSRSPEFLESLEELCRAYWYPLYAFVRRSGYAPEESRDLTQEFFARLLEKKWLTAADPARGRFRTFLLAALKHFLTNEWHRSNSLKRGGGREVLALDTLEAEDEFALESSDGAAPDKLFDRNWAVTLIGRAQDRLRDEMKAAGEGERFEALEPTLAGERIADGYQALATRFGVSETGIKSMVSRLRGRFRALLCEEIAQTLSVADDVETELRHLLSALSG
jgi:DNA-directed RNA polymerase specialized sigma24 family protein